MILMKEEPKAFFKNAPKVRFCLHCVFEIHIGSEFYTNKC